MQLNERVDSLEKQIVALTERYSDSKQTLEELKAENRELKNVIDEQKAAMESLKSDFQIGRIVKTLKEGKLTTEELNQKLDEYIRKTDSCIAFLNRQL